VADIETDADARIEPGDPGEDRRGGRVAKILGSMVVDGQLDPGLPDPFGGPAEEVVFGNADDDAHAAGTGVGERAVDLGRAGHVDDAAAVEVEPGRPDLFRRRPDMIFRAVEGQVHVLQGDAVERDPPGHGQGGVEVEFAEGIGREAQLEGGCFR
jgi:hypothetical protein